MDFAAFEGLTFVIAFIALINKDLPISYFVLGTTKSVFTKLASTITIVSPALRHFDSYSWLLVVFLILFFSNIPEERATRDFMQDIDIEI